jgi:hypothetical protein
MTFEVETKALITRWKFFIFVTFCGFRNSGLFSISVTRNVREKTKLLANLQIHVETYVINCSLDSLACYVIEFM